MSDDLTMSKEKGYNYYSIPVGYYDLVFRRNKGIQSFWHAQKFSFIADLVPASNTHLDVGCGPGTFLGNFVKAKKAVGIDIASDQVDYALARYGCNRITFRIYDGINFPFENASFEVVSIIEVIEHLPSSAVDAIIRESLRVLVPGGKLIISTPNYNSFWPILELLINKVAIVSYEEQHINKYTNNKLRKLISNYDVTIDKSGSFMFASPFLSIFGRKFSYLLFKLESKISFLNFQLLSFLVLKKE